MKIKSFISYYRIAAINTSLYTQVSARLSVLQVVDLQGMEMGNVRVFTKKRKIVF